MVKTAKMAGIVLGTVLATLLLVSILTTGPTTSYSGSMKVLRESGRVILDESTLLFYPDTTIDGVELPLSEQTYKALAKMRSRTEVYIMH